MQFTRLRLSGFKSFVDPSELRIEPGLTGVVGPNGCGKSNLLEALRWVMGENSAKSMRGSGMDDVIFAGTSNRSARNLAEVSLLIDNQDRLAPSAFNDEQELEVSRRIERESGSAYRVNGKDVRARDVQLLFADAATGAHSPALVSQGRIGALISARPQDRRAILEEAAGISGLHSRRNEAERRLRAAEANLVRLHDVTQQIESQLASLRRQAGQARRYSKISAEIRQLQALHLYNAWKQALEALQGSEAKLRACEIRVSEMTAGTSAIATEQAELSSRLPTLRNNEATAAAGLHRLSVARDSLAAEEQRLADIRRKLTDQMNHVTQDVSRERSIVKDTDAVMARIVEDRQKIAEEAAGEKAAEETALALLEDLKAKSTAVDAQLDELKSKAAGASATRNRYMQEAEAAEKRLARLRDEQQQIKARLDASSEANELIARVEEAEEKAALAAEEVELAALRMESTEQAVLETRDTVKSASAHHDEVRNALSRVSAERDTLEELLAAAKPEGATPLIDKLKVRPGYEAALGAVLGDDLEAPVDEDAPVSWTTLPDYTSRQPLPAGTTPLADYVTAPDALKRRLHQTGVVEGEASFQIIEQLAPGQRLVNAQGAFWRWDGYCTRADAPSPAAIRLAQRNRLAQLRQDYKKHEQAFNISTAELEKTHQAANDATLAEQAAKRSWREAEEKLSNARRVHGDAERQAAEIKAQVSALKSRLEELAGDQEEIEAQKCAALEILENIEPAAELEDSLRQAQETAQDVRQNLGEARADYDNLALLARHRIEKAESLAREAETWKTRRDSALQQMTHLTERAERAKEELLEIEDKPAEIAARREALAEQIEMAEAKRAEAAHVLAEAEEQLAAKDRELHQAQTTLSEAREERVRLTTGQEQLVERRREITLRIAEEFECPPQKLLESLENPDPEAMPSPDEIDQRLAKLKAERERMGPVNLRAEVEVAEFESQLENLNKERADLETAISRLRQAISSLNREGRERLLAAFEKVNDHFGTLFATLFGGGHAHLALTESDDPLQAGLEIMASPPGKRLQSLSLLSGGEQALTALSLIFAVFVTNPAPICVLDEVDAPLDDANVERFCDLLDDMVVRTKTRFLIVTHNAVTMSRMNRLYGVTMVERGISQLVSVDLERVEALRAVS